MVLNCGVGEPHPEPSSLLPPHTMVSNLGILLSAFHTSRAPALESVLPLLVAGDQVGHLSMAGGNVTNTTVQSHIPREETVSICIL